MGFGLVEWGDYEHLPLEMMHLLDLWQERCMLYLSNFLIRFDLTNVKSRMDV